MATPYSNYSSQTTYTPYMPGADERAAFGSQFSNMFSQPQSQTASSAPRPQSASYNASPAPTTGVGPYGAVPGQTAVPPSTYQQVGGVMPQLGAQTQKVGQNVMNQLNGVLSPETMQAIQQHAAEMGIQSGMPGSQFGQFGELRSLGLTTEGVQQQGLQSYLQALQGVGATQNNPALLAEISQNNAMLGAAPDPRMAAQQMQQDYLNSLRRNAGGGGGSFGPAPSAPTGLSSLGYSEPNYHNPAAVGAYSTEAGPAPASQWDQIMKLYSSGGQYGSSDPGQFYAGDPYADEGAATDQPYGGYDMMQMRPTEY